MKSSILILAASLSSVLGFVPPQPALKIYTTQLEAKKVAPKVAEKKTIFRRINEMDLYAPFKTKNEFGARSKKDLRVGKIDAKKSYIPSGMNAAQYTAMRNKEQSNKDARYAKAKANTFTVFTDWYIKRGTDVSDNWRETLLKGHTMVKTKYDWQADAAESFKKPQKAAAKKVKGKK